MCNRELARRFSRELLNACCPPMVTGTAVAISVALSGTHMPGDIRFRAGDYG